MSGDGQERSQECSQRTNGRRMSSTPSDCWGVKLIRWTGNERSYSQAIFNQLVGGLHHSSYETDILTLLSARLLLLHTPHAGTFCAGADLRERRTMSPAQVSSFLDSLRALISELEAVRIPSVGIVDGYALGGGTEIALGCDLRVGGMCILPFSLTTAISV